MRRQPPEATQLCRLKGLPDPLPHLGINHAGIVEFQVMHPHGRSGMSYFFEPWGVELIGQGQRQHGRYPRMDVLVRPPQVGESTMPSKGDLALGDVDLNITESIGEGKDGLADGQALRRPVKKGHCVRGRSCAHSALWRLRRRSHAPPKRRAAAIAARTPRAGRMSVMEASRLWMAAKAS